jgi:hypothetical protein
MMGVSGERIVAGDNVMMMTRRGEFRVSVGRCSSVSPFYRLAGGGGNGDVILIIFRSIEGD